MQQPGELVLELRPSGEDTWLYASSGGSAFLAGDGEGTGLLTGPIRWSASAQRTDRWEVRIEGTIRHEGLHVVGFTIQGLLLEKSRDSQRFRGGMTFKTVGDTLLWLNQLYASVDGVYLNASGALRLRCREMASLECG